MAVQQIIDITERSNNNNPIEIGGWDYAVVQFIGKDGSDNTFLSSNDSGALLGVTDGNRNLATNFMPIQGLDLADRVYKSSINADTMVKFEGVGNFLRIIGASSTKVIMRLYKIN